MAVNSLARARIDCTSKRQFSPEKARRGALEGMVAALIVSMVAGPVVSIVSAIFNEITPQGTVSTLPRFVLSIAVAWLLIVIGWLLGSGFVKANNWTTRPESSAADAPVVPDSGQPAQPLSRIQETTIRLQ